MAEIVYPPVVLAAKTMFRVLDNQLRVTGTEHSTFRAPVAR